MALEPKDGYLVVSTSLPAGWLTIAQAAAYFGVSRRTVARRIAAGDWPISRLPGMRSRRFSPEDWAAIEAAAEPADDHRQIA